MIPTEFKFDGFSAETCRSLIAILDDDRSGKLGYDEFKQLWNDLRMWKVCIKKFFQLSVLSFTKNLDCFQRA